MITQHLTLPFSGAVNGTQRTHESRASRPPLQRFVRQPVLPVSAFITPLRSLDPTAARPAGPPCSRRPQAVAISPPTTPAPRTRLARRKGKSASTPAIFPLWTICGCLTLHITVPANGNGEPQRTALRGLRCMWLLDGGVVDQTPS